MSSRPAFQNPREWLQQQLDTLNELRNAGTRAPAFRAWRQSTLTAIQRTWPGDTSRSERFRRIPFSAPSSRAEGKEMREWYERGCAEAAVLLKQFMEDAPAAPAASTAPEPSSEPGSFEDDFPTLELPGSPAPSRPAPKSAAKSASHPKPPAVSPPAASAPAAPQTAEKTRGHGSAKSSKAVKPHKKAPRRLKDMLGLGTFEPGEGAPTQPPPARVEAPPPVARIETPPPPARVEAPPPVARVETPPPPARVASPPPAAPDRGDPSIDPLLTSDMLRMIENGMRGPDATEDAARRASEARAASAARPPALEPLEIVDVRETPREDLSPENLEAMDPAIPAPEGAGPALKGIDMERFDPRLVRAIRMRPLVADPGFESGAPAPTSSHQVAQPEVPIPGELGRSAIQPIHEPEVYSPAPPPAPPEAPPARDEHEDADRATELFFLTSPVLTSRAQPVRKHTPAESEEQAAAFSEAPPAAGIPEPLPGPDPDEPHAVQEGYPPAAAEIIRPAEAILYSPSALGVQALASTVGRLGVPEGHRARARATLTDLARQLETGNLAWDDLRDAVQFAMEFPALAVRLVPLLLPYFEDAA